MSPPIIIDASVVIKWVVPETGSQKALGVRKTHELFAPELIIPETANYGRNIKEENSVMRKRWSQRSFWQAAV